MKVQAARMSFRGVSVVRNCKAVGIGSRETSRSIRRIFWRSKQSSIMLGLSGRSGYENLMSEVVNI